MAITHKEKLVGVQNNPESLISADKWKEDHDVSGLIENISAGNGININITNPANPIIAVDSTLNLNYLIINRASGYGIKVDNSIPTYGWRDILGNVTTKNTGLNKPTYAIYKGNIEQTQFPTNSYETFEFHIPHDYVLGSNIYLHVHWSHISTLVTGGTVTWGYEATYSKGHNQASFGTNIIGTLVGNASNIQYQHIITEGQFSTLGGSASQIKLEDLEIDGLILASVALNLNNMTGATPNPFVHYVDLHYQSTNISTKEKSPGFY